MNNTEQSYGILIVMELMSRFVMEKKQTKHWVNRGLVNVLCWLDHECMFFLLLA